MFVFKDDFATNTLGVIVISVILCNLVYRWIRSRNYPPGPVGLPFIGYGLFLGKNPHIKLQHLGEKYGDIFSFYNGTKLYICVTEYHLIKDILNHPNAMARPPHMFDFLIGKGGWAALNGEDWKEQRRFTMHTLKNLGLGRGLWERMIQEDATTLVEELKKRNGKPVFFEPLLARTIVVNILSLLFGRHLDQEDEKEEIKVVFTFTRKMLEQITLTNMNMVFPSMFKILEALDIGGLKGFIKLRNKVGAFIVKEVEKRISSKNECTRDDYIGCFLMEMEKRKNEINSSLTVDMLVGNISVMMIAGNDGAVGSVGWLLLLMAKYPGIQKRICEEIDEKIGREGTVCYEDKIKLPYTLASIMELQRWVSMTAIFPPRYVTESFTFKNYKIPQGAFIICNGYAMMQDPRYFKNPMTYEPERFLADDGSVKLNNVDGYGPFSFGRRNCPGDGIAIMTIYLYFVSIMQKFSIKSPPGKEPDMDRVFKAGIMPKPQELCFIER